MKDTNQYSYCNVVGNTDVGCKRKANEDWYAHFECQNGLVSVVCDGMGGHVGGAVASHLAVETIQTFLENNYFEDPRNAIIEACNAANSAILQRTSQQPDLTGMGSTCVMLIVSKGRVYLGSVGDSRIYLIRSKRIKQLTKDQSYVQMLVDEGAITKEEAEHHPRKNEITNALGLPSMQPATVLSEPINPEAGDCFLLCSDGLSGMVSDHEILKVASNQTGMTQRERVTELIQRARKNGGLDNITCLIVEFAVTPTLSGSGSGSDWKWALAKKIMIGVAAFLLLGVVGLVTWKYFHKEDPTEYLEEVMKEPNTGVIETNDTVMVINGQPFVQIKEDKLGTYVYVTDYKRGKDTITFHYTGFKHIDPDSIFTESMVDGCRLFTFNNKNTNSPYVLLKFYNETNDSTFVYAFPVKNQAKKISKEDNPNKEKKLIDILFQGDEDAKQEQPKQDIDNEEDAADNVIVEETITVKRQGKTTVKLISGVGTPSDTLLYTAGYAIKSLGHKVDGVWYSYTTDGSECNISIINNQVPKNAKIDIPLKNCGEKSFVIIYVKVKGN